jgi:hypothetical protein
MMSPHIYRLLAHERHRDLLLEADSSRLAREAIASRPTWPARSNRRAARIPLSELWPQPRGDTVELPGRPLQHDGAALEPDLLDTTAAER